MRFAPYPISYFPYPLAINGFPVIVSVMNTGTNKHFTSSCRISHTAALLSLRLLLPC